MRKLILISIIISCQLTVNIAQQKYIVPKPQPGIDYIIKAFDRHHLIALGERHGVEELYRFYNQLISHPKFAQKVNDIVLEMGNALHQPILDRYIAGEAVSVKELRKVWYDHTNCLIQEGESVLLEKMLQNIREVNLKLPAKQKIRVLAGDPPLNWQKVKKPWDFWKYLGKRDYHYLRVVWDEVLDKNRRALLIMGRNHFKRKAYREVNYLNIIEVLDNIVGTRFSKPTPEKVKVIHLITHSKANDLDWKFGSIAEIKNTWIGGLRLEAKASDTRLEDQIDAVLFIKKPKDFKLRFAPPFQDTDYLKALNQRSLVVHKKTYKQLIYGVLGNKILTEGVEKAVSFYRKAKKKAKEYDFAEWQLNLLGYDFLGKGKFEEAITIFRLNTEAYPQSANAFDSLAEAYAKKGGKELAIRYYEKSLMLNPKNKNARKMLRKLKK